MKKIDKDIETLFAEIRNASAKLIVALNDLSSRGRNEIGEIDSTLIENVIAAQNEWRKAVDFYNARKKEDINSVSSGLGI